MKKVQVIIQRASKTGGEEKKIWLENCDEDGNPIRIGSRIRYETEQWLVVSNVLNKFEDENCNESNHSRHSHN